MRTGRQVLITLEISMPSFRQARGAGSSLEADMMSTFELGQMLVRRSGYGAMQLAGPYASGPPPDRASAIGGGDDRPGAVRRRRPHHEVAGTVPPPLGPGMRTDHGRSGL